MPSTFADTFTITLWIAGDIETARRRIHERAYFKGMCVTLTPTTFVYTGGEEAGMAIGFVNYPRFPKDRDELRAEARTMAEDLMPRLNQRSALLVDSDRTEFISDEPPGARR